MINTDGAGLIAQLIPVLVLVLAVERRMLGPTALPARGFRRLWWWVRLGGMGASVVLAFLAVAYCVIAVSSGTTLTGWQAAIVSIAVAVVGFAAMSTFIPLTMRAYVSGSGDGLAREADPARHARRSGAS